MNSTTTATITTTATQRTWTGRKPNNGSIMLLCSSYPIAARAARSEGARYSCSFYEANHTPRCGRMQGAESTRLSAALHLFQGLIAIATWTLQEQAGRPCGFSVCAGTSGARVSRLPSNRLSKGRFRHVSQVPPGWCLAPEHAGARLIAIAT